MQLQFLKDFIFKCRLLLYYRETWLEPWLEEGKELTKSTSDPFGVPALAVADGDAATLTVTGVGSDTSS